MIVREILNNPQLIETFDFFNDFDDTIAWLTRVSDKHLEANEIASRLRDACQRHGRTTRRCQNH